MKFKKYDLIKIAKVEERPGFTIGQGGMHGVVLHEPIAPMQMLGEFGPTTPMEYYYEVKVWWPLTPESTDTMSVVESWLVPRSE
jgi:hypothetical protein